jgi:hypothetical protein
LPQDNKDLEEELQSVRKKVEGLQEDLEEGEAIAVLEEAVGEVERLGEKLEEGES